MNHPRPGRSPGWWLGATATLWLAGGVVVGQEGPGAEPAMRSGFGGAVHAYYTGDYQRSYDDLTLLVDAGSIDPRVWFFRGLAAARLGRSDEAAADYATGATHEARRLGDWNVSRSLERVQGADRLLIERERRRARVQALAARGGPSGLPVAESFSGDADFLRPRKPEDVETAPVEKFTEGAGDTGEPLPPPGGDGGGEDPGADAAGGGAAGEATEDTMPAKQPAEELGGDDPAPAAEPAAGSDDDAPMTDTTGEETGPPAEKPDGELPAEREPPAADAPGDAIFGQ